jgi:hypothetical protein
LNSKAFFKMQDARMHLPMLIGDFSDFMCARTHVDNVSCYAFFFPSYVVFRKWRLEWRYRFADTKKVLKIGRCPRCTT